MSGAARLWSTDYPAVRRIMGPERAELDDDSLEEMLEVLLPPPAPPRLLDGKPTRNSEEPKKGDNILACTKRACSCRRVTDRWERR